MWHETRTIFDEALVNESRVRMYQVTSDEAKSQLDALIEAALRGEQVIIAADSTHAVQLIPAKAGRKPRKAGSAKGLIAIAEDFDAPLAEFEEYTR